MGDEKENKVFAIPYIVYEAAQAKDERNFRRIVIALIIALAMLFISNLAWLYAWNQYEYIDEQTVTVDGADGIANYINNGGSIINGEGYSTTSPEGE